VALICRSVKPAVPGDLGATLTEQIRGDEPISLEMRDQRVEQQGRGGDAVKGDDRLALAGVEICGADAADRGVNAHGSFDAQPRGAGVSTAASCASQNTVPPIAAADGAPWQAVTASAKATAVRRSFTRRRKARPANINSSRSGI